MFPTVIGSTQGRHSYSPTMNAGLTSRPPRLFQGTGESLVMTNAKKWIKYYQPKMSVSMVLHFVPGSELSSAVGPFEALDIRTIAEHMENIRAVLDPSMSELARELGVTRQAVYKWVTGETCPEDQQKLKYIKALSNIADKFSSVGIENAKVLVKMKAFDGRSLMDLVKNEEDWQLNVDMLIKEAFIVKEAARVANVNGSKASPSESWRSSISIPASDMND